MKIWLMNHYSTNQFFDQGGRHYWFAKYLLRAGYKPVVFGCNSKHGSRGTYFDSKSLWQVQQSADGFPFVIVRSSLYTGNGISRAKNMLLFSVNLIRAAKKYAKIHGKPDVIVASSVHPFTILAGEWIAKRMKVPCIAEIRDLWPETLYALKGSKGNSVVSRALYAGERYLYKKADTLIFTMEGGWQYLVDKKMNSASGGFASSDKVHWICNGIDFEQHNNQKNRYVYVDEHLDDCNMFKIIYIGSIRKANGLENLVAAASLLKDTNVKFLVFGEGDEKIHLEKKCSELGLDNVVFKGRVERRFVPYILSKGQLTLLNYGTELSIFRYGGSQNKLFQYLASGKPVLSNNSMGEFDIIRRYQCGVSKHITSATEYASEISSFLSMHPSEYDRMCENALRAAKDFDFQRLTEKLIEIIEGGLV